MPDLHGYEVVGELTVAVLNNVLQGAWDNDIIPHSTNIAANTPVGPYHVRDGVVNIARDGVSLVMDRPANGVRITLHCEMQAHIADPPVQSAGFFDIEADVAVSVPIGVLPDDSKKVAALLNDVPRSAVSATITSGNPIPGITADGVAEYVHEQYQNGVIQDHYQQTGVSFGGFTGDAWLDVYDDQSKPNHHITVVDVGGGKVKVLIPVHLKVSNLSGVAAAVSPIGVVASIALTTPVVSNPGSVSAPIKTSGVVTLEGFGPAPASDPVVGDFDSEGSHYTTAKGFNPLLESAIQSQLTSRATEIKNAIGDIVIPVPSQSDLEGFIADQAHSAVVNRGNIGLWTPNPPPGGDVTLRDVKPQALTDAIAFCINAGAGADSLAVANFIPAGFSCGIAISASKVLEIVNTQIHKPESEGGFGPDFPHTPHHENADGHDAKVTRLDVSLRTGSIHVEGDVTVVDAIADSIDVDASFEAEIGLKFQDNADGTQTVQPFTISQDVDLSLLAWIISFLTGFITFGIVGGIIALVVMAVVEGIAEKIGGTIIRDEVTGQIKGIGAWPQSLDGIGEVHAKFENPILIDPTGILFADAYHVVATFASVTDALADANGPYSVPEGSEVEFDGGPIKPDTTYSWDLGDGTVLAGAVVTHRYADNGLYVAKLTTVVHEKGGVTTRHFAAVRVTNVPATVDAGPPITIDEGAVTEFTATFTDPGWVDTHKAIFDFGDNSMPVVGAVTETNNEPLARGTAKASHAYCDNGTYTVSVRVIDDDGGVGVGTKTVTVRNVPPTVDAGDDMFAYPCTPITLVGHFTDPGWCDTHTATWDFGDCTPPLQATVRERHEPPEGCGIAAATHRYDTCGHFVAVCTVTDDDGGVGRDSIVVRVVDVVNGGFEDGFRTQPTGVVGNYWSSYSQAADSTSASARRGLATFVPEEFVVHRDGRRGQRSQRCDASGIYRAGIYQRVGANVDWDYQVSAWFHSKQPGARCSLGIDPNGGTDPSAASIVWTATDTAANWTQLAVRCTAVARAVTIFLECSSDDPASNTSTWFDDVELLPYPCPLGDAPPCKPPQDQSTCVDWKDEVQPRVVSAPYTKNGFTFEPASSQFLRIVAWGPPANTMKLALPPRAMRVTLPFAADRVVAHVWSGNAKLTIGMEALNAAGGAVGVATTTGGSSPTTFDTLDIRGAGIAGLLFVAAGDETTLIDLCIYKNDAADGSPPTRKSSSLVAGTSSGPPQASTKTGDCGCH